MMLKTAKLLAVFVAALMAASMAGGGPAAAAQERPDSLGKDFWVTFMKNYSQEPTLSLFISSPSATSGKVEIPGLSWSQEFTVTPGTVTTVSVPGAAALGAGGDGKPSNLGVHVTAADEVSIYGLNRIQYTTDAFLGLPVDVLGTDHVVLSWPAFFPSSTSNDSEFAIVGVTDGTEVTYTPTANTRAGVTAGTPTTVTLNAGQTLPVTAPSGDLSGSTVTSSKPVAVFGGQMCGNVPDGGTGYCDHLAEQIPSTSTWGKEFLTVPLKTRLNGDSFRMIAAEDGTNVSINGAVVATLNRGQVHQQIIDGRSTISADRPILVAQYSNGEEYDGVISDPFMMLIPPTKQFLNEYTFATPADGFAQNFVNVVSPTAAIGGLKLDGSGVPGGAFNQIDATDFSGAQLDLTAGSHTMSSSQPFGVYVYGFDEFDSYGYPGGAAYAPISEVRGLTLTPATQQVQINTKACVDAKVVNQDGAPLAGIPVQLTISGVNPGKVDLLTGTNGIATHCYTSATAGADSLKATFEALSAAATVNWVTKAPDEQVLPKKARKLPIIRKQVKGSSVQAGSREQVVLVKSIRTNKHGRIAIRAKCRPVNSAGAGEVSYCRTTVSKKGKVTVYAGGYPKVRVVVTAKARPKKGERDEWLPNRWRKVWTIKR